jgi:hypothetical protein
VIQTNFYSVKVIQIFRVPSMGYSVTAAEGEQDRWDVIRLEKITCTEVDNCAGD